MYSCTHASKYYTLISKIICDTYWWREKYELKKFNNYYMIPKKYLAIKTLKSLANYNLTNINLLILPFLLLELEI